MHKFAWKYQFPQVKNTRTKSKDKLQKGKKCGASLTDQKLRSKTMGVSNRKTGKE